MDLTKMSPPEIADEIMKFLKTGCPPESRHEPIDNLRLGLGLALSAVHAVLIMSAKGDEQQESAVKDSVDTVHRLLSCLKRDCDRAGIKGVQFVEGTIDEKSGEIVAMMDDEGGAGPVH